MKNFNEINRALAAKKKFLLVICLFFGTLAMYAVPTITVDGNKADWAEVPMLTEPGTWPMLKVLPAADATLGTNALVYMMENTVAFDPTWAQYPTEFIDKDYDKSTEAIAEYWAFDAMGVDYKATTGVNPGTGWISFPKAMSADNKVFEIGFPATYITDLGSKFGFAMYYNSGAWFCPDRSEPAKNTFAPANGFLYKTRSYTTVAGTTNLTTANVYAHPSMGEVGEYVDFGLRDNGYDTLRWAAFPINLTKPAVYDVTVNLSSTNDWKFEFWLVDVASNVVVAHLDRKGGSSSDVTKKLGTLDLTTIPAGKYMLKVQNKTAFSKVKLNSIDLTYAGGAAVSIPGTLNINDIILSNEAWVDKSGTVDSIFFTAHGAEGHNPVNYVKWKINVASASAYNFKANVYRADGSQRYEIKVLSNDESVEYASNSLIGIPSGLSSINSGNVYLESGIYTIKVRNTYEYAKGALLGVVAEYIGGAVQAMPGTTDINDAWFSSGGTRADGKIDFPDGSIQDGWVKWNVSFASAANYNVTVNIDNTNGHNYTVALYRSETDESPITLSEGSQKSTIGTLELGAVEVPAGSYILKVTNAIQYSDAKLVSVQFVRAGGGVVNIPGTIALNEAILSSRAFIDGDALHFTDADHLSTISGESAKWNIRAAADGLFKFTANCNTIGESYSNLTIKVLHGGEEKYTYTPQYSYTGEKVINSPEWFLEAGDYELQLSNPANHSNGYLVSLSASAASNVLVVDENATDMQYIVDLNGQSRKPLLKRSFTANMYNTVLFPFNGVTNEELESIFGAGYQLLEMTSATLSEDVLDLQFAAVDLSGSTYGRPYLVRPTQNAVNPLFNSHTIYKSTSHLTKTGTNADFIGSFIKFTIPASEDNLFLGANDKLYFANEAIASKGLRAYFQIHDAPAGVVRRARIVQQGNVVTELEFIAGEWVDARMNTNGVLKTIENGQLILIRDGVRYNVMGQIVK